MFWLWAVRPDGTEFPLRTSDGKPLSEKDADTIASKFDPSRRPVSRPTHYKTSKPAPAYFWEGWGKKGQDLGSGQYVVLGTRQNRQTGTNITVGRNPDEDPSARWETICQDHGSVMGHPTRKLALSHAASPAEWCDQCGFWRL